MKNNRARHIFKVIGFILTIYSAIILILNRIWLSTGDIYKPNFRFFMRRGRFGYYLGTYASLVGLVAGIVILIIVFAKARRKDTQKPRK